ncbi:MAG TPA: ABC transporter ATP-binding protein [Nitrospinota bacterium]|nr:ABC transporter ATP-binding protein [Nitrospinota bacterium]|tara:strand:+ start:97625 stop:98281 length:657 start_codon:yes stop_codon:yes gene_type:complete
MIKAVNLCKSFSLDGFVVEALKGVSFVIEKGSYTALMGPSGSGKTTLMNIIGCLDTPTSGQYELNGRVISDLDEDQLSSIRNNEIGFIFQSFNLMPRNTVLENVCLPLYYRKISNPISSAIVALSRVGLDHRGGHYPNQISGGESQRVAIARAIVTEPSIILADEPTGNLDTATGDQIMGIFKELNELGATVLLVTHDQEIATHASRILQVRDGLLTG